MDKIIIEPITSMKNAFSVAGQNVVITGGNRGLGRGIAQAFAECGANVAILCRNEASGNEAAEQLRLLGSRAIAVKCDVGDFDSVLRAKEVVASEFDHIDTLVNNAGIDGKHGVFDDARLEEFKRVMNVNLDGVAAMIQVFGQWMMDEGRGGEIINISSIGGQAIGDPARTSHAFVQCLEGRPRSSHASPGDHHGRLRHSRQLDCARSHAF